MSFCEHHIMLAFWTIYIFSYILNKVFIVLPCLLLARKVLVCGYSWKTLCSAVKGPIRVSVGLDVNRMCEIGFNLLEAQQFVQCRPKPILEIVWVSHLFFTHLPNCFSKIQLIHLFTVAQALKDMRVRIYVRKRRVDGNYRTIYCLDPQ